MDDVLLIIVDISAAVTVAFALWAWARRDDE